MKISDEDRLRIYKLLYFKYRKIVLFHKEEPIMGDGICIMLKKSLDLEYFRKKYKGLNINKLDELKKLKPISESYWFSLDITGMKQRLKLLKKLI